MSQKARFAFDAGRVKTDGRYPKRLGKPAFESALERINIIDPLDDLTFLTLWSLSSAPRNGLGDFPTMDEIPTLRQLASCDLKLLPTIEKRLEREGDKLRVIPCLPPDWKGFKLHYRLGCSRRENTGRFSSGIHEAFPDRSYVTTGCI